MPRQSNIIVPTLAFPFQLNGRADAALVVEQNSDEDVADALQVLLSTDRGERIELPDYGLPDQAFLQGGTDLTQIQATIDLWEERARIVLTAGVIQDMIQKASIEYRGPENG